MIDYLLKNGMIVDGSMNPSYQGDLGISDGRILLGRSLNDAEAGEVIELSPGELILPGFCDIHGHNDLYILHEDGERLIRQGITTTVNSNCGLGVFPVRDRELLCGSLSGILGDYSPGNWADYSSLKREGSRTGIPVNGVYLTPHSALRLAVAGLRRELDLPDELVRMTEWLRKELGSGSAGFSTGLVYPPACFSTDDELLALAETVAAEDKLFAIHIYDEGERVEEAVEHAIGIAEKSGARLEISHLKAYGEKNWDKIDSLLEKIERAADRGVELYFDSYPYTAGSTAMISLLPPQTKELEPALLRQRLTERSFREEIKKDINRTNAPWENYNTVMGYENIYPVNLKSPRFREKAGRSLESIAGETGVEPPELIIEILLEEDFRPSILLDGQSPEGIVKIMTDPRQSFGSDGLFGEFPHPRAYGAFVRVFTEYVFARGILSLEEAVYKCSAFNFKKLGIGSRGLIKEGYAADLLVINPALLQDRATMEHPAVFPEGIRYVFINGRKALDDARFISGFSGAFLEN